MAKNLKLTIKNTQIAEAINLGSLKNRLAKKKGASETEETAESPQQEEAVKTPKTKIEAKPENEDTAKLPKEEAPRIKARSKSAFAEGSTPPAEISAKQSAETESAGITAEEEDEANLAEKEIKPKSHKGKSSQELRKEIFGEELVETVLESSSAVHAETTISTPELQLDKPLSKTEENIAEQEPSPTTKQVIQKTEPVVVPPVVSKEPAAAPEKAIEPPPRVKLGPTGRHINDLLPPKFHPKSEKKAEPLPVQKPAPAAQEKKESSTEEDEKAKGKLKAKAKPRTGEEVVVEDESAAKKGGVKTAKAKEFRDIKPGKRIEGPARSFDARDRQGLKDSEEDQHWRKRRAKQSRMVQEDTTIRPSSLTIRIPISIRDLAAEMKLKASQLISKLFLQGVVVTLNDLLEDETTIQLLGQEFGCEITIDTTEEQRIRITDKTVKEEITATEPERLTIRPPVVAFMGHVDHGKTSLIDAIRKSNRASGEAGAITQHIGAFRCQTSVGDIAILDTPGHEAFSAMRARGADVTDIVVLVVAGDEGIRQQTLEAIQHAKAAGVTIVVAINKSDKPNFNPETVYRQLSDQELLPEAWGGQTITVNCSAVTGEGIQPLLEMLALQAEVLELKADPSARARGRVLESEMHKGMGAVATVLVQNGTLKIGDAVVFDQFWGRVKTMQDEYGQQLQSAGPSTPVEITGLSGLPEAGQEFIVVKNEREAREIAEVRMLGMRQTNMLIKKKLSMENLFQQASESSKKVLNIVLRGDVQGSVEALKVALMKIESTKAELNIIFAGVGEVSESDVQLAAASKALILGFHTQIESHADALVKQLGVQVRMHDIIYHAIDDVKSLLTGLLDKIAQETEKGKAIVKAIFKSSHHGVIAGCQVTEGSIHRNNLIRIVRDGAVVGKCSISSLKRVKEDVREVQKGLECGIVLNNFSDVQENDILEAYEVTYISQEL